MIHSWKDLISSVFVMQPSYMVGCLVAIKKAQVCPMICNWLLIEVSVYI